MEKILFFGYTMDMGGAEKSLLDTVNFLSDKYDISLYLLDKKGILLKDLSNKVKVYEIKKNIFQYILFRYLPYFRKKTINRIANKEDYSFAVGYIEGRSATWVSDIKKNIKKIAWIHCDVSKFDIGISDTEAKKTYDEMDKIICVSKKAKESFCKKYSIPGDKVSVIYNFINEDDVKKKALEFDVNNRTITFTNVAKMRDEKRQDRLVNAANNLKKKGYRFKIQLIGDGPNLEKIKKQVEDENLNDFVEILGLKKNPYPYIKNCDYFILTSDSEGYGIVIKEALTLKKKIISTDTVGPNEILDGGHYGIIIPNTDISVQNIIKDILDNPKKYDYLDERLLNYTSDNNGIKKEILQLFKEN